jgi:hypothetical protein
MVLTDLSAVELSKRIRRREISCREVMAKYLERIDEQLSRGEHLGWMHGLPQAIKDLWWVKGLPATSGSKLFEHFIPDRDSLHVERVKAAGGWQSNRSCRRRYFTGVRVKFAPQLHLPQINPLQILQPTKISISTARQACRGLEHDGSGHQWDDGLKPAPAISSGCSEDVVFQP